MVINMTELPLMNWSPEQLNAARKMSNDGVLKDWVLPTILPSDSSFKVRSTAWQVAEMIDSMKPEAVIIQGEPVFVHTFIDNYCASKCYSPCYQDGKFVQFRRF